MIKDEFFTITKRGESLYKEKGSKFYGFSIPVKSTEDVKNALIGLRKEFHDARHVCYAYKIDPTSPKERANDDGEPSNSAGAPILGQIHSSETFNILVAVIRYFGGTKLGVPGLIRSYKTAAAEAIEDSGKVVEVITSKYTLSSEYQNVNHLMRLIKSENLEVIQQLSEEKMIIKIAVKVSKCEALEEKLKSQNLIIFEKN